MEDIRFIACKSQVANVATLLRRKWYINKEVTIRNDEPVEFKVDVYVYRGAIPYVKARV